MKGIIIVKKLIKVLIVVLFLIPVMVIIFWPTGPIRSSYAYQMLVKNNILTDLGISINNCYFDKGQVIGDSQSGPAFVCRTNSESREYQMGELKRMNDVLVQKGWVTDSFHGKMFDLYGVRLSYWDSKNNGYSIYVELRDDSDDLWYLYIGYSYRDFLR